MAELLCRVCLVGDIKMRTIENTELQQIYELLAKNQLVTEDGRPKTICYICYSQLQRCGRFSNMVLRSEKIFRYLLNNSSETTQEKITKLNKDNPYNLEVKVQDAITIDSTEDCTNNDAPITVKLEFNEEMHNTFVKEERETDAKCSVKEEIDYENTIEIEIEGLQYDPNLENPLPSDTSNIEGVINVPTSKLLTQLEEYMVQRNQQMTSVETDTITEASEETSKRAMETIQNSVNKRMKNYNECEVCHKVFHKRHDMDIHKRLHNGVKPYACNSCDQRFSQMSQLNLHVRTEHTGYKKCMCNICNRLYSHANHLKRHMEKHVHNLKCERCVRKFTDRDGLQQHNESTPRCFCKVFRCNDCTKSYTLKSGLQKHILRVHNKINPYVCKLCKKSFYTNVSLERHSVSHFDFNTMQCNICRKSFRDRKSLRAHINSRHLEKPYECHVCDFRTAYGFSLRNHLQRMHDINN